MLIYKSLKFLNHRNENYLASDKSLQSSNNFCRFLKKRYFW